MINQIKNETEEKMNKTIATFKRELSSIRAGRANPTLLDRIVVEYYGTPTPLNQLANISAPEPRMLVISPWDAKAIASIEKSILVSDLGLNPSNDGKIIRLLIPQLTEERRKELVKLVKKQGEDAKVAIRNERRDGNDKIKVLKKDGEITEDEQKKSEDDIQKLTDKFIKEVDSLISLKEKEIMEV